ncbi:hypothetical protein HZF24_10265 [Sedimentibacter hydroxybenzoicus DSM 7310]|uniref:KAP NTPase domain-containing protein n=1 Tax=Sedimentibacter hydroxybenzoicus DSM 7310 TaxID=1123245 RepID=A0A974BJP3_SEDHY|nr:P-loop NTPase fold protein [Sedimentibacter hydroxybenzoicus]NYB74519.1 hypothetical protein [Sedimentibacter hydroxybenzoicus DSM 7310]
MFNTDSPITTMKDDLLNRDKFAKQLAQAVLSYNQSNSFNIGLYGEWGSGKTSVINMVEESIISFTSEQQEKPVIIRFNPWLFSDQTQLTIQFFKQLSSAFKRSSAVQAVGTAMEALGAAFELTSFVPLVGTSGGVVAKIVEGIGKGLSGKTLSPDIQNLKNEIADNLKEKEVKTIIIIDDIDRLSNEEIRSVFQLVKSIADFPNTIYLLAFDYEIVTRALGEVQNTDGQKYLEKIIQVPFQLPKINEQQLIGLFFNGLNNIIAEIPDEKFDKERWSLLFLYGIKNYIKTIRDVVRLNNTISLKYSFLKDEVNIIDLIGITTIQVFAPSIYERLQHYKDNFCGEFSYYSNNDNEKNEFGELYESIINNQDEIERKNISEILSLLFPKVNSIVKNNFSNYNYDSNNSMLLGSICNKDYFDRYFSLSFSESLSLQEAEHIIFKEENRKELNKLLLKIDERNQTNIFLNYFNSAMRKLKKSDEYRNRIDIVLSSILENWDNLHDVDERQFFSFPWVWRLMNAVDHSLKTFSEEADRFSVILNMFNNTNISLYVKLTILSSFEREYNRYSGDDNKDRTPDEYILSLEHVLMLEEICFHYIEELINNDNLINIKGFSSVEWFVENSENETLKSKFHNYMNHIIQTDDDLARLISSLTSHGKGAGNIVYELWNVDLKHMSKYSDIEEAVNRMNNYIKNDSFNKLNRAVKEDIIAFLVFYEVKDEPYRESVTRPLIEKFCKKHDIIL